MEPNCPQCGRKMVLRNGPKGPFYGCSAFPRCRAIVNVPRAQVADAPMRLVKGSPEQEEFWNFILHGEEHGVLEAVAGSGKTFSIVQAVLRMKDSGLKIGVVAFNNHIAREMNDRLSAAGISFARALTYNSLGYRACRAANPQVQLLEDKIDTILGQLLDPREDADVWSACAKMARLCKCYLFNRPSRDEMEWLLDRYDFDVAPNGQEDRVLQTVPRLLEECLRQEGVIDFDDQCWFPVVKGYPVEQFDLLFVDEAQDTNRMQQELAFRACPKGRIVFVGDRHQSIYGFRGADVDAIPSMEARLRETKRGVRVLPLSMTRRCPKSHVALAQQVVPQIRPMPDAPEGEVLALSENAALDLMAPGDLVLCRVNAPLISVCYSLLRRGVRAVIRGRDVGKGILSLIKKLRAASIADLMERLREYEDAEMAKLMRLGKKGASRIAALQDKVQCVVELASGARDLTDLRVKVEQLFSEFDEEGRPKNAVVLGTVHRTKGLEANRVFVLKPELIPHPAASQPWEREQERNLAYVAVTRAKFERGGRGGVLVFVGQVPPVFAGAEVPALRQ